MIKPKIIGNPFQIQILYIVPFSAMVFNNSKMLPQTLSLPKPLIAYILGNGRVLRKLFKCCKYFYYRRPYCIVDRVKFEDDTHRFTIDSKRYKIRDAEHLSNFHNIWVTKKIAILDEEDIVHQLISKIVRCDAEKIYIKADGILKTEFDILTKSGNVKSLECSYSVTDDTNNSSVPVEDLMVNLVSAKDIE